jgi:4-hydroxy 2-oxovalerate aldolase
MIKLLDCTLRDGGFVNDWEFGYSSIRSVVNRLDAAFIDIIEVGFIDSRRNYDRNCSIFPDTLSVDKTLAGLNPNHSILVGMIDFGTCPIDNIADCRNSILDGIRLIFKKSDIDAAMDYLLILKSKGYKVFANPVSITAYSDGEILLLISKLNVLLPDTVSIVDTYGLMLREEILHYITLFEYNLNSKIALAYHSHNNQQMAFSNCCTFMDFRCKRDLIIDTTLYGMGKSAGNANTELVAQYINKVHEGNYLTEQILECIYSDIMRIYQRHYWGYNLHYYISATNDCHPNYVKFLLDKNTLSVNGVNTILSQLPSEAKLSYSQKLIDKLYIHYNSTTINDSESILELKSLIGNSKVLLIFPGKSIYDHREKVAAFICDNNPLTISINFLPDYHTDYVFVGNLQRYNKLADYHFHSTSSPIVITTTNILPSSVPIKYAFNYESLINLNSATPDNSAFLIINLLRKIGLSKIYIAGLDGFSQSGFENYADKFMELSSPNSNLIANNADIADFIKNIHTDIIIDFITPSQFDTNFMQKQHKDVLNIKL